VSILDILLLLCLFGYCVAWLLRVLGARDGLLWGSAAGALLSSLLGVFGGRWQAAFGGLIAGVFLLVLVVRRIRGAETKSRTPLVSGVVFLLLTIVAFLPLYWFPVFRLPQPEGPHAVGVRDFELKDFSRLGVLFASAAEPRRLAVRVWYPAETVDGLTPRPYASDAELQTTFPWLAQEELGLPPFFFSHLKLVATSSYEGAAVLESAQRLPVLFFSHGLTSFISQNTVLMEDLASKGYCVFSVAHTYDAAPVVFPNGDIRGLPGGYRKRQEEENRRNQTEKLKRFVIEMGQRFQEGKTYDERFEGLLDNIELKSMIRDHVLVDGPWIWLADNLFVVNALANGEAPDSVSDVLAVADFTRVGYFGMSYGASAAAATAYEDPRCAAAIALDGSDFHQTLTVNSDIPVPFLMLYSDTMNVFGEVEGRPFAFNDFSYERFETAGLRDDVIHLHVKNALHNGVSDLPLMVRGPLGRMIVGPIDGELMIAVVNDFVGGFFDHYLRGVSNGFPREQFDAYSAYVEPHDVSGVRNWWSSKSPAERAALEAQLADALHVTDAHTAVKSRTKPKSRTVDSPTVTLMEDEAPPGNR